MLLVSMLDHLGIEAHPALVNTRLRKGLLKLLPAPTLFDHAVVSARIDGRTYWLDPTRSTQKVGRNDPCPCGSGKKFKQCHGKLAA